MTSLPPRHGGSLAAYAPAHLVRTTPSAHRFLYVSGTTARQPDGSVPPFGLTEQSCLHAEASHDSRVTPTEPSPAAIQFELVCDKVSAAIRGASGGTAGLEAIVDATIFLTNLRRDYAVVNEVWNRRIQAATSSTTDSKEAGPAWPARTCVEVSMLPPDRRVVVEMKCTAVVVPADQPRATTD